MNKKLSLLVFLFTVLCLLFTITGCYEPTKEELKTFEERGWVATIEAESEYLSQLKKWANIPEDAKILNVSRYGGELPKVVVFQTLEATVIKQYDDKGNEVKAAKLVDFNQSLGKDAAGNINAYIAEGAKRYQQGSVVFLDEKGVVEKETKVIHREKAENDFFTLKENEGIFLSNDGQYIGKVHAKWTADPALKSPDMAGWVTFSYMDRAGNILWRIKRWSYGFEDVKISPFGNKIALWQYEGNEDVNSSYTGTSLVIYDKNGNKLLQFNPTEEGVSTFYFNKSKWSNDENVFYVRVLTNKIPVDYKYLILNLEAKEKNLTDKKPF